MLFEGMFESPNGNDRNETPSQWREGWGVGARAIITLSGTNRKRVLGVEPEKRIIETYPTAFGSTVIDCARRRLHMFTARRDGPR